MAEKRSLFSYQLPKVAGALRKLRADRGWSLREVSRRCGVSAAYLCRMESGEFDMRLETIAKVAVPLGISPGFIVEAGVVVNMETLFETARKDPALSKLMASARKRQNAGVLNEAALLFASMASALAYLALSSSPTRLVGAMPFPTASLKKSFEAFARLMEERYCYQDKALLLESLSGGHPVETLVKLELATPALLTSYLKGKQKQKRKAWNATPDLSLLLE